jgi:hypothetical protein
MLPIFLVVLLASTVLGAPRPSPSGTSSIISCAPHVIGYALLSEVSNTSNFEACTPPDGSCANLNTSVIAPVGGQTYDICGNGESVTRNRCVGANIIVAAAAALDFNCNIGGMVGGSFDIGGGISIQL